MNTKLSSTIRYLRVKEKLKLDYLAKKLGISKSHLSLIERGERKLYADDLENTLETLGYEFKILKNGEDIMKKMNLEIVKEGLNLTECGYSKDFLSKNNELIRVEFDTLDMKVVISKDMLDETKYLSTEKFLSYEEKYDKNNNGYGLFYEKYYGLSDDMWDIIMEFKNDSLEVSNIAKEIFTDKEIEKIQNIFLNITK